MTVIFACDSVIYKIAITRIKYSKGWESNYLFFVVDSDGNSNQMTNAYILSGIVCKQATDLFIY